MLEQPLARDGKFTRQLSCGARAVPGQVFEQPAPQRVGQRRKHGRVVQI
jgi:hypothetical protein